MKNSTLICLVASLALFSAQIALAGQTKKELSELGSCNSSGWQHQKDCPQAVKECARGAAKQNLMQECTHREGTIVGKIEIKDRECQWYEGWVASAVAHAECVVTK